MKVIIGNVYQPTLDAATVTVTRAMSDPVPTCTLHLKDNTSTLKIQALQEIIVLDEQVYSNPSFNIVRNPSLNPYNDSNWSGNAQAGETRTQIGGGGLQLAISNGPNGQSPRAIFQFLPANSVVAGQIYTFSCYVSGVALSNIQLMMQIQWLQGNQSTVSTSSQTSTITGGTNRYVITATAPAGATYASINLGYNTTSGINSGTINYTQVQCEINLLPTLTYPTPWIGPSQTNCQQLPLGFWIRQYRKFAGFVLYVENGAYHGNARTLQINAVGYAWLMGTIYANDSFSGQADSAIISSLLSKYLTNTNLITGTQNLLSTTNVVTGVTMTTFGSNWDDLRTLFDTLAANAAFYWTVDYYWGFVYAPPSYFAMTIALICDNSATPDLVTTFPAYNFSSATDYTQPGSTILVIGSGSNVAEVIDPSTTANNGIVSGYTLPTGTSWMRKVNDATLQSVADCTNRGMAELLQYDNPRGLYRLTTNVELLAGYSIQVTSATDGLSSTSLLLQKVTATWIGMSETLTDTWEYQAELGATNRAATNILSRLARLANKNTSAPAISTTTLALIENLSAIDTFSTSSATTGYVQTIQADTPLAYYRLDEASGTIADDISGNMRQGTINGGVTLGVAGLLHSGSDTAMTFNGTSGYISLPTALIPTGSGHAWSLECWVRMASLPSGQWNAMVAMGNRATGAEGILYANNTSSVFKFDLSLFGTDVFSSTTFTNNTTYHVVGTYDGTQARLYVNGSLTGGPTTVSVSLATTFASIGADGSSPIEFFPGTLDEVAIYNYALSAAQVSNHYTVGTT